MPRLRATIWLPYWLKLDQGYYRTGQQGMELELGHERSGPRTTVSLVLDQPDSEEPGERNRLKGRQAGQLLNLTNRLIRCYRACSQNAAITDLSRATASPFRFQIVSDAIKNPDWESDLTFEANASMPRVRSTRTITQRVRALVATSSEPDVAELFLLDAEQAIHEGRFREAIVFCWATIDATFNRRYGALVEAELAGEWAEAREFFKGIDFGLRNKMSAALFLVAGKSFFREPNDLWQRLSTSYNKRNAVIHRGESADEADARLALEVARRVVEVMSTL